MDRKIKVGAVNYLNTKPLIYDLDRGEFADQIELVIAHPARLATMLLGDEIDIGLIPIAILPEMKEYELVSNFCIGTLGEVASVCLFSDVPIDQIKTILLDYQSRTSSVLISLLIKYYWKLDVRIEKTKEDYQDRIKGTTAGLVIGDRAFRQRMVSSYIYDLGIAWKALTGLPFVFAAWVSKIKIRESFTSRFNELQASGIQSIPIIVQEQNYRLYDLNKYYNENLSYTLDEEKLKGLAHFLELINNNTAN